MPVSIHIPIDLRNARSLLPWSLALFAAAASAQTPPADQAESAGPTWLTRLPYASAISGYQAYSDQPVESWREVNDRVGRIGGWRAYAKEIATGEPAKESSAADPHSGHHGGAKP